MKGKVYKLLKTRLLPVLLSAAIAVTMQLSLPVYAASANAAAGKTVTASTTMTGSAALATDGNKDTANHLGVNQGLQWIQIDLGAGYSINKINLWHYFGDGRTYHDVIVRTSTTADFSSGVNTVFNNDTNNSAGFGAGSDTEYAETSSGKTINFSPVNARYVRLYSDGSSSNAFNHYVEVEVWTADVQAPAASIYVPSKNEQGTWICLDGSNSTGTNPMGVSGDFSGIKSYSWNFGDGSPVDTGAFNNTITHKYASAGTYNVSLTVTDYNNLTATTTATVNVAASLPKAVPNGFTASDINNAIASLNGNPGIVNLSAGTYSVSTTIKVPANVVLQGAGTTTVLKSTADPAISITGSNARITNLKLQGPGLETEGIAASGFKNVMIDHCDISNFSIANTAGTYSSVTYEFNTIHDNTKDGLGYGVMVVSGAYAMIRKNEFYDNRHSVAGGGKGSQAGWKTSYDIYQNTIGHADNSTADVTVDAHAGTQGRIRINNNTFKDHQYSIGLRDGWGEIKGNSFTNINQYICKFDKPVYSDGVTIPGAGCNNFDISGNTITNCNVYWRMLYGAGNIVLNGRNIDSMIPYTGTGIWQ